MAEALDTLELVAAPSGDDGAKLSITDLPKELLVSVFIAVEDDDWVRDTVPLVCKEWAELYRSKDASPLHETLEVDFEKEVENTVAREGGPRRGLRPITRAAVQEWALSRRVHASRVISWAERRAGSVRELHLGGGFSRAFEDFGSEDLGTLVAVVGSSLTKLWIGSGLEELCQKPLWESLRKSVVPARRLRSFIVESIPGEVFEADVEPLGQLAGSLEELGLFTAPREGSDTGLGLPRFPESFCALTELRCLEMFGHDRMTAIPAQISSLKKLETVNLGRCDISSLPKELGELTGLTKLDLTLNENLGNAPQDEASPAEPRKMKSLRHLRLGRCGLRTVPAFVGGLQSLEVLALFFNDVQIDATLDILIKGCPRLRSVILGKRSGAASWTLKSREHLKAFKEKLLAKDPNAVVEYEAFSSHFSFFLVFFCFARSVLRERAQGGREGEFLRRAFGVQKRESVEEREGVQKREKIFFNFSHSPRATRPLCEIEAAIFLCRQNYKTERCWGAGGGGDQGQSKRENAEKQQQKKNHFHRIVSGTSAHPSAGACLS